MEPTLEALLERVRERGGYPSPQAAARATQAVLTALGAGLADPGRRQLAARVPAVCVPLLMDTPRSGVPLTPQGLLDAVAARDGGGPEAALVDADAVLGVLAETAGDGPLRGLLDQLPPGHTTPSGPS